MWVRSLLRACALTLPLVGGMPVAGSAQTADDLFDAGTLQDVQLRVNTHDLQALREHYQADTYYPADLIWNGTTVRNVGIRSRGSGSRNPVKLGLRVDFDRYVGGQTLVGLGALVLDNLTQDPAMVRERTAMALFARLGQAAPREAFCRLYINGEYQGVYALVEPIDKAFLAGSIGEDAGYLFEYRWLRHFYGEDLGEDLGAYAELFEPKTHERQAASLLYDPIREMFRAINSEDDALWEERVGAYLDLHLFMTQAAVEAFLADIDGLLGEWGMNNFYVYRSPDSSRHRPFPWDIDVTVDRSDYPLLPNADANVIFRRAFARSELRGVFLDVLEQCARSASQDDWLLTEIETTGSLITPAAHADTRKPFSNEDFDAGLARLRDFARQRPAFVLQEVDAMRGR